MTFIRIKGVELIELNDELKNLTELDLRYLSSFEFDEKFMVKMSFKLQHPNKRQRIYQICENQKLFNIFCRKMKLFHQNYIRKISEKVKKSLGDVCQNCGNSVDLSTVKNCPNCLAILKINNKPSILRINF